MMPATSSFLGRDEEISALALRLGESRLVTLTGPPGIGKSRLALETAHTIGGRYPGGARLVELAAVADAALTLRVIAAALAVSEVGGQSLQDTIIARLCQRRLLLVLDNCEHLLDACATFVAALLEACPGASVLATSREPLRIAGEVVWQVHPLSVPDGSEAVEPELLARYEAVRLFVDRSRSVQPGFTLNAYVAPAVAEICRRLDGIPLAIELAAARVEMLTPAEIARRLDDRYALLTDGGPSPVGHHQTLLDALDWSHELLSAPERALLRRLSVFTGGFELEAAEAVCGGEDVSQLLGRLASKSLVVLNTDRAPGTRYRLLETVRAYAAERLEEAGEAGELRVSHARFHLALAERAEPEFTGPDQQIWFERIEAERGNLRAAFDWSLGHGQSEWALRLAGALVLFWRVRCHFSEGRELLEAAVSASDDAAPELRANALWGVGFLALMMGDLERAFAALQQSRETFCELEDRRGEARALLILGNAKQHVNDAETLALLMESAALARLAGDRWCLAHALGVAGFDCAWRDDLGAAHRLFEECLEVARDAQDEQGVRIGLLGLGSVTVREGDYRGAESLLREAAAISDRLGDSYSKATALEYLGQIALGRGEYDAAQDLLEETIGLLREASPPIAALLAFTLLAEVARAHQDRARARALLADAERIAGSGSLFVAHGMGELAADEGDLAAARGFFEQALERARATGLTERTGQALFALGELARIDGDLGRSAELHGEALALYRRVGNGPRIVASVEAIAGLACASGTYERAAVLLGAAHAIREANGYARVPGEVERHRTDVALVFENLGDNGVDTTWGHGASLSLEEAVLLALKLVRPRAGPADGWESLTRAERRVAELVAEGLTNPEIAERLFIAMGTVKAHLTHIFQKLAVSGRTQLAREVWRRDPDNPVAGR